VLVRWCSTWDTTPVSLFKVTIRPGDSIFAQVVFAAQKAILSGDFSPGQAFPSVRALAAELRVHPKTAQKIIQHLVQERWLEVRPGIGTVVAVPPAARRGERKHLLQYQVEQLAVEAKRIGVSLHDVVQALSAQWNQLEKAAGDRDE
jgi:GntR family transcriptional regulator